MECLNCDYYDKEERLCEAEPSEISDIVCLLRCVVWLLGIKIEEDRASGDEGEEWKSNP